MATVNVYLDKRRNLNVVRYRINHRGIFYITTSIKCDPKNWKGKCLKGEPNYRIKNETIIYESGLIQREFLSLNDKLFSMSNQDLKEHIEAILFNKVKTTKKTFINYLDEFISTKSNKGTRSVYLTTRNKILDFDPKCTFETMDKKWLISFRDSMSKTMKVNSYSIHFRNIRAVFNYAIDNEITNLYPFRKFSIKSEKTKKRNISVEQLRELKNYPVEPFQEKYRDMFMLIFYLRGINIGDLCLLKHSNLKNGYIEYKRQKTGAMYFIKVEPEAMEIINRYKGKKYLLNILDTLTDYHNFTKRMNSALKGIGVTERKGLGGKKHTKALMDYLSTYWARHTWATLASSIRIPKEVISAGLGHSSGSVTDIYIEFDQRRIDRANRRIIDYLNGDYTPSEDDI